MFRFYMTNNTEFDQEASAIKHKLTQQKIFIADDDKLIIELLRVKLSRAGYEVISCDNALDVIFLLKKHRPDLVLLDVMMPAINGFALLRKIKSDPEIADLPIIFLTAKTQDENMIYAMQNGAADYIKKPVSLEEVLSKVQIILSKKNAN